jgi:hypothetical protein
MVRHAPGGGGGGVRSLCAAQSLVAVRAIVQTASHPWRQLNTPVLSQQVEGVLAGSCTPVSSFEVTRKEISDLQHSTAQHTVTTCVGGLNRLVRDTLLPGCNISKLSAANSSMRQVSCSSHWAHHLPVQSFQTGSVQVAAP